MKIIDLSHTMHANMSVFPGTEPPHFEESNTVEKDGFQETKISMYSHTGTHIDAPAHMLKEGAFLGDFPIEHFMGSATIIDIEIMGKQIIELKDILIYEKNIKSVEYILIKTGWSKYWGEMEYFAHFPTLSIEAVKWLIQFSIKGIGIDTISIDAMNSTNFPIHYMLFHKNLIVVENLTNLDAIKEKIFLFCCMPLKYDSADGSPVRAIGIL